MFAPSSLEVLRNVPSKNYFPGESTATSVLRNTGVNYNPIKSRSAVLTNKNFSHIRNGQFPNGTSITRDRNVSAPAVVAPRPVNTDEALAAGTGLLGTAALAAPVLAPAAIAAGVGFGTYKLGQALHIW